MSQPLATITVKNPGLTLGQASYFDVTVSGNTYITGLGSGFDAWCADAPTGISNKSYTATIYSTYELNTLGAVLPNVQNQNNLDLVSWIINQNFTANPQYNYGEIQASIWTLLGDTYKINGADLTATGAVNINDVNSIIALAKANGENFVPDNTQLIGVMFDPTEMVNGKLVHRQPLILGVRAAKIGDFVWEDTNANGIQDAGENGIGGVTVNLGRDMNNDGDINDANEILATTTTDNAGSYQFKGLTPGLEYQVQFVQPTGFDAASLKQQGGNVALDSNGLLSNKVILSAGEYDRTIDAGFYKKASLGDFVWNDTNADGIQDAGEAGIAGVTVNLLDASGNVAGTAVTDANGNYNFADLIPGTYSVQFVAPTGYNFSNLGNGTTAPITLTSGEYNGTLDAGLFQKASLGDFVWHDLNADGIQDAGEAGIASVTANLIDANGNIVSSTTTDANGNYKFAELIPGTYSVQFVAPVGYNFSNLGNGTTAPITLTSGEYNGTLDAGLFQKASLGDFVWHDLNADGIQDAGEAGIAGVTVKLLDVSGNVASTAVTSANGAYNFANLNLGTYSVQFVSPNGYSFSSANSGNNDSIDSDANANGTTAPVTLTSGEYNGTLDAGLFQKASLGDFVWHDLNADGIQDAGEGGIAGVTVKLLDAIGNVASTAVTSANGAYNFANLNPGTYSVQFVSPNGYSFSSANSGNNDSIDSDANSSNGITQQVTLASGASNNTLDTGFIKNAPVASTSKLGDYVWHDLDKDGIQDTNESGIAGIKVTLVGSGANGTFGDGDDITRQVVTDANGKYLFDQLAAGTYKVTFERDSVLNTFSSANQGADVTKDSNANALGVTGVITLGSNETNMTVDAGLYINFSNIPSVPQGSEGLTPGFWKNWSAPDKQGRYPWADTNFSPTREDSLNSRSQTFGDAYNYQNVFGVQLSNRLSASEISAIDRDKDGIELLEALGANGNTAGQALLRHSAAGILNASHSLVDYPYTAGQVVDMVQQAFATGELDLAKNILAQANELEGVL
jgi:protocatechuate 3,4-dioxygenase beta subunit